MNDGEFGMARAYVGTSGWSYDGWVGPFYPDKLPRNQWLAHYAQHLGAVELNASFYRLPMQNMLKGWAKRTPEDFSFSVKAWQQLTHRKRLRDCGEPLQVFFERMQPLADRTAAVLFQMPPKMPRDVDRLEAFLRQLPAGTRAAFEFRDPRWHVPDVTDVLARHNAAFVPFELAEQRAPAVATADFVYVRLHGREAKYRGRYGRAQLQPWADWLRGQIADGRDAFVFFDNTDHADDAVRDALEMRELLHTAL
ncbi:MAG: DUF72 domain-containing protein [Rhodovibrio sp.]|nr:DUF72 domain-containing protein [Rhodovibrio sp.]